MTRARQHLAAVALLLAALVAGAGPAGAQTNVSGSNNVGVGVMSGGTINNGISAERVQALLNAQGKQRDELVRKLVADLNQQAQRAAYTEASVQQFVVILTRRQVPPGEWQQALGEITRRYLELEARLSAIPVTSEQIKALVARAEAARLDGRFDEADALLGEAVQMARADAQRLKAQFRASSRQAASVLASQASLALTRLDRDKGVRLLVEAFEQRADDVEPETFDWLIEAGDAALADGRSARALQAYQRAQRAAQGRLVEAPGDPTWLRGLSISHERIGDVQSAQGDLGRALKSLRAGLEIARKLAERDPGNALWQTDLAFSCWKLSQLDTPALPKAERRALLERGLAVLEGLQQRGRLTPDKQTWPDLFRQALQKLN